MALEIRRILCAVDYSEGSLHALRHAAALAGWCRANLSVLHVHHTAPPLASIPFVAGEMVQPILAEDDRGLLARTLKDLAMREAGAAEPDIELLEAADVPAAIVSHATESKADLLVLGTHGRSGLERFVLGSIAEKALRRARCATLTVPPRAFGAPALPYQRIVCALDFSHGSERALEFARDLAARGPSALTLLHVVELPPDVPDIPQADLTAYRAARFDQARRGMAVALREVRSVCPASELLLAGRPGREIVRLATEQEADLIVLGVHGRNRLDVAVFGSVAHHVVRHAACPVVTVRVERPAPDSAPA
jgi:nucleotide-binding universal stress UspA family protein